MVREIITLPMRLGVCATRLGVHVTTRAAGIAIGITRRAIEGSQRSESPVAAADAQEASGTFGFGVVIAASPPPPEAPRAVEPAPRAVVPEPRSTPPSAPDLAPAPEVRAVSETPPAHVSEGLEFVEAFAEPGAEEGAGAAVHVREPWTGYAQLTADEVIVHLAGASPEELAAVTLYEGAHRGRKTVLAQARRQLRLATAGNAAP